MNGRSPILVYQDGGQVDGLGKKWMVYKTQGTRAGASLNHPKTHRIRAKSLDSSSSTCTCQPTYLPICPDPVPCNLNHMTKSRSDSSRSNQSPLAMATRALGAKSSILNHEFPAFYACYLLKSMQLPLTSTA